MNRKIWNVLNLGFALGFAFVPAIYGNSKTLTDLRGKTIGWKSDAVLYPGLEIMSSCSMIEAKKAKWIMAARNVKDSAMEVTVNGQTFTLRPHGSLDLGTTRTKNCGKPPKTKFDVRTQGDSKRYFVQYKDGVVKAKEASSSFNRNTLSSNRAVGRSSSTLATSSFEAQQSVQLASFTAKENSKVSQMTNDRDMADQGSVDDSVLAGSFEPGSATVKMLGVDVSVSEIQVIDTDACTVQFTVNNNMRTGAALLIQVDASHNGALSSVKYEIYVPANSSTVFNKTGLNCGGESSGAANNYVVPSILSYDFR